MDKIGDLLNRFATVNPNAKELIVSKSKYKLAILKVLYEEGWIAGVSDIPTVNSGVTRGSDNTLAVMPLGGLSTSLIVGVSSNVGQSIDQKRSLIIYLKRPYIDGSQGSSVKQSGGKGFTKFASVVGNLHGVRISKPGRRVYYTAKELNKLMLKEDTAVNTIVVSTSKGVMSISNAVNGNLGGELLFKIGYVTT